MTSGDKMKSLMQQPSLTHDERQEVMGLIWELFGESEETYTNEWVPYLSEFPHHWVPFTIWTVALEQISQAREMMPFAHIGLEVDTIDIQDIKALPSFLCGLSLQEQELYDEDVSELLAAFPFDTLDVLKLNSDKNMFGEDALRALGASQYAETIHTLTLASGDLDEAGVRALFHEHNWPHLKHLSLRRGELSLDGFDALFSSPIIEQLETLELHKMNVTSAAMRQLGSRKCPHLHELRLRGNQIDVRGIEALVKAPWMAQLKTLDISYNQFGAAGAKVFAESPSIAGLCVLEMAGNQLGDEGTIALATSPYVTNLRELDVYLNDFESDRPTRALAESSFLCQSIRDEWKEYL